MQKIAWITPEYFLDVDLPVIEHLKNIYQIHLIIVLPKRTISYEKYINKFVHDSTNVEIEYFYQNSRMRSLRNFVDYYKIISSAKRCRPDAYYISLQGIPYAILLYKLMLPLNRCVAACHNVVTPKGATNEQLARIYTYLWIHLFKNIQVFSNNQYQELLKRTQGKHVLLAPLMLKDYGEPKDVEKVPIINFLFFGNILEYKRLDLLLTASEILYSKGYENFHVTIAGNCGQWDRYQPLIKHSQLFTTRIERIPNEDVPDLFAASDFFVLPYQDIAQSGAITVAFRYNVPVIISDIPQFDEFYEEGKTGFSFHSGSAEELAKVMASCLSMDEESYSKMKRNQLVFVNQQFSKVSIVNRYDEFLRKLCDLSLE